MIRSFTSPQSEQQARANVDTKKKHCKQKFLSLTLPTDSFLYPLFVQNRLQVLAAMRHINITAIYSITPLHDNLFQICTESCASSTLGSVIDELSFLGSECSIKMIASILVGALEALAYLAQLDIIWGLNIDMYNIDFPNTLCVDDRGRWKIVIHKLKKCKSNPNRLSNTHASSNDAHNHDVQDKISRMCQSGIQSLLLIVFKLLVSGTCIDLEKYVISSDWNRFQKIFLQSRNEYEIGNLKIFITVLRSIWDKDPSRPIHPYSILRRILPILQTYMQYEDNGYETMYPRHIRSLKYSPLMLTVLSKDYEQVKKNILYVGCRTTSGMTALMLAARDNLVEAVRILVPYENQYKSFLGTKFESRTALMFATHNGNYSSMSMLYEYEVGIANVYGATSMMRAAYNGEYIATKMLMKREAEMINYIGITALMNAATKGFTNIVSLLLTVEAGIVTNDNYEWGSGHTALSLAVLNSNKEVAILLYEVERHLLRFQYTLTSGETVVEELLYRV